MVEMAIVMYKGGMFVAKPRILSLLIGKNVYHIIGPGS